MRSIARLSKRSHPRPVRVGREGEQASGREHRHRALSTTRGWGCRGSISTIGATNMGPLSAAFRAHEAGPGRPTFPAVARGSTHSEQKRARPDPRTGASQRPRRRARPHELAADFPRSMSSRTFCPPCGRSPRRTRGRARPGRQCRPSVPPRTLSCHDGPPRVHRASRSSLRPPSYPSRAPHRCITARRPRGRRRHPPPPRLPLLDELADCAALAADLLVERRPALRLDGLAALLPDLLVEARARARP